MPRAPMGRASKRWLLSLGGLAAFVALWSVAVWLGRSPVLPGPGKVLVGIAGLARSRVLFQHVVASLFRVTWGFLLAALAGIPLGLCLGWFRRGERALNPILQILRPISPLAWIPIAILWFGVGDRSAIFIIFLA